MNLIKCVIFELFHIEHSYSFIYFFQIVGFQNNDDSAMPNLLDGNYEDKMLNEPLIEPYTLTTHQIPIDKNANYVRDHILCTGMGQSTSPDVPDYDYSIGKPVDQDEISLFLNVAQSLEPDDTEESVNVTDCGKCEFMKEENKYAQAYFEQEYGDIYCSNDICKNPTKKMREFIDSRSDNCFWVCKNCKRNENDTHGCSKMLCNTCYFSKDESNNSGRKTRARRARAV